MFQRTTTERDFLKTRANQILTGQSRLTPEQRYNEARQARQFRNFWFTATTQYDTNTIDEASNSGTVQATTPRFSEPMIITEILNLVDFGLADPSTPPNLNPPTLMQLTEYGGEARAFGQDYFGASELLPSRYLLHHEKNRMTTVNNDCGPDVQEKYLPFVPRLIHPFMYLRAVFNFNGLFTPGGPNLTFAPILQLGFRAIKAVGRENPYSYLPKAADDQIRNYINTSDPETFYLTIETLKGSDLRVLLASVGTIDLKTPQQDRPLLILGATTNIVGAQASLESDAEYYKFTYLDNQPSGPAFFHYLRVPLNLWATIEPFRNVNSFNMWPLPHLLLPGGQLKVTLSDLWPFSYGVGEEGIISTPGDTPCRITFLCRTV